MHAEHLYIHVPFCGRRCVYCDFSIAVRSRVPISEYLEALDREWAMRHGQSELDLRTVYLGGGTPSRLGAAGISRLLDLVRRRSRLTSTTEMTLEANPEDVTRESARAWLAAGINRVSLGVQSFDDRVLRWMHRTHTADAARQAVEVLLEVGVTNISVDLIFSVPAKLERRWEMDLDLTLRLHVPHVSVYGLTIEEHTPLGRWVARKDVDEAPEEDFEREFLLAHQALTSAGFDHYEVSNYGRPGKQSRHNWAYWERRPYAGLGPSAHEFDGMARRWNSSAYAEWMLRLLNGTTPTAGEETLSTEGQLSEELYLSLRTDRGVLVADDLRSDLSSWIDAGWAIIDSSSVLRLTPSGWLRLDTLANHLTLLRSRSYI